MNGASMLGIAVIVTFLAAGAMIGSVRSFFALAGMIVAYTVVSGMPERGADSTSFALTFAGVFIGITAVGFIIYGATKFEPIEAFEGMFGFIFCLFAGWGVARFILLYLLIYTPDSPLGQQVTDSSSIAWDIYTVSPYQFIINSRWAQQLLNPKI